MYFEKCGSSKLTNLAEWKIKYITTDETMTDDDNSVIKIFCLFAISACVCV